MNNHLSHQLIELKKKRPQHMKLEQVLALVQAQKYGGVKLVFLKVNKH
jgi:hypothetical protein